MSEIRYVQGDATQPFMGEGSQPCIITHIVNDRGLWGKGFVMALSRRWPRTREAYLDWARQGKLSLGSTMVIKVEPRIFIANIVGQHDIYPRNGKPPIRYDAIRSGLETMTNVKPDASFHMPRIGCGLAGGQWDKVESILQEVLVSKGFDVTVYDFE